MGWTRFVLLPAILAMLALSSCFRSPLRPSLLDEPAIADSLLPADQALLMNQRFENAGMLAQSGRSAAALDSLRNLFIDLQAPSGRPDSLRWALQLATAREMARLLEVTGPDPKLGEGFASVDFQVQLLHDELGVDSLVASTLVTTAETIESDSLLEEVLLQTDSLSILHLALPDIPDCDRSEVDGMVEYFVNGRGRKFYQIWLDRYPAVAPVLKRVLQEEGMPEDLIFLAMIESGFRVSATSRAKARGPWQFMTGTAHMFDLRVDYWMDERLDLERSTRAACRFLRKLYDRYDDWYLAMAAYNWGPGRIDRAVARGQRDYFGITKMPNETRNYVPTFLAARRVFQDLEMHGFTLTEPVSPPDLDLVSVEGSVRLNQLATVLELPHEDLSKWNMHLTQGSTPPDGGYVYVPMALADACRVRLKDLPQSTYQDWVRHKVRRGETLSAIARRYSVSLDELRKANKLGRKTRLKAGRMLLIPLEQQRYREQMASATSTKGKSRGKADQDKRADGLPVHKVKRGDVPNRIASQYGIRLTDLMTWNQLKRTDRIYPGQELLLADPDSVERLDSGEQELAQANPRQAEKQVAATADRTKEKSASTKQTETKAKSSKTKTHVVRSGETAGALAQKYGISVKQLRQLNKLDRRATIFTGQRLRIPGTTSGPQQVIHVVRSGESLSSLARQYKVKVSDIRRWNKLQGNRIHAGSSLVIILSEDG